jgi:hypothetical protein
MKVIRLTHKNQELDLSVNEAVSLHKALEKAMTAAGIDPATYATVERPHGVETFSQQGDQELTDC